MERTASRAGTVVRVVKRGGGGESAEALARHARFGALPERIPFGAMVEEQAAGVRDPGAYDPDRSLIPYNCLALDLGL